MSHPIVKLGHVAKIKGGKRLPLGDELVPEKTAHPYVRARDIRDGKVTFNDPVYVTDDIFQKIKNYTVKTNDVCITIVGANVGDVGIIPPFLDGANLTENAVKLTELRDCDPFFLNFCLLGSEPQGQMKQYAAGAAQPKLGIYKINEIDIPFPPLETQRNIASILSAYDDLIENNTRRIKVLEEMARMIYREWFVNFRFPGHEKVKMVDSPLGLIPEGWEVKPVTEAVEVNPRTKVPLEGEKAFVPMGLLSNDSMLISGVETRSGNSGSKFKNGDTLFARITPCIENGKTGFVQILPDAETTAFGSTEFIVLRSKTLCPEFVYLMARSSEFRDNAIKSMSGASGRQRVSEKCFEQFFIAQPCSATLEKFSDITARMFKQIQVLADKNQNLRQTRDLLLPKLISGELEV